MSHLSNGSPGYDTSMTTTSTLPPQYDSSPRQSYMINGELYSEIPELQVPKGSRNGGTGNGYIFEDDLYSDIRHSNGNKVLMNGNGVVLAGSLDRRKVHDLYSKPNKKAPKRKPAHSTSSGGFDNPAMGGDIYESAHQYELQDGGDEEIYGYSTSLA